MADDLNLLLTELQIRLFQSRKVIVGSNWSGKEYRSSFWRLYMNTRSGAAVVCGEDSYELAAGRMLIVPAWLSFKTHTQRELGHFYIHFDLVGLNPALVRRLWPRPIRVPDSAALRALSRLWVKDVEGGETLTLAAVCRAKALTHMAVSHLVAELSAEDQRHCSRYLTERGPVSAALEHIDAHLGEALDVGALAEICHVGPDHFTRIFRKWTGVTPAQYVLDARIRRAAHDLVFGGASIDQIASDCGFCDRFHFSRAFKKRMLLAPAEYRRRLRSNGQTDARIAG